MDEEEVKDDEEVKKVILFVTSDSVRTQGATGRNSTGKANARTLPSLLSSDERILPRYLQAPTNSCHEFCKYGKKHVFEAKKSKPSLRRESGNSEIPDGQKAEFSAPRGMRKKPEPKSKTEPKGRLLEKPKVIKKNSLKEIHQGTHAVEETDSCKAPECTKLRTPPFPGQIASLQLLPFDKDDESSEEPANIEIVTPSPIHRIEELSDASETTNLDSSSPTEKRVISHGPITPLAWSEKSSDGSESMELELPSPIRSTKSQVDGSLEEPMGVEILTPAPGTEIMEHADGSIRSAARSSTERSLKAKILPPIRKSTSAKARPSIAEGKSSAKGLSMKVKAPPFNPTSVVGNVEENRMKNLKNVEGKKGVVKASPGVSENAKVVRKKRIGKDNATPTVVKETIPSPLEKTTVMPVKPKVSESKRPSSIKKVIIPVFPRVAKQKTLPTSKRMDTLSEPLMSLKSKAPALKRTPSPKTDTGSKIIRSIGLSKLGESAVSKPSRISTSTILAVGTENTSVKDRTLKPSSPANVQPKIGKLEHAGENVRGKTMRVIEPKTLKTSPTPTREVSRKNREHSLSRASSLSSSLSVPSHKKEETENSESTLYIEKTNRSKPVQSAKHEVKRLLIRRAPATVQTKARFAAPHILNFRRGKIVSPVPEINTTSTLKLRQAKDTSENSKEAVRRTVGRRRVSCGSASELISPGLKAPAVVLRHQDVQEEKDVQGLFNDVIEETASKLVEAKKSKVKALVGAFETVISLQESRVPPTV